MLYDMYFQVCILTSQKKMMSHRAEDMTLLLLLIMIYGVDAESEFTYENGNY